MAGAGSYAKAFPEYLAEFREANPQLVDDNSQRHCDNLLTLLTLRHREMPDCCYRGELIKQGRSCFLDHAEDWRDSVTGLPVIVAHPYCKHNGECWNQNTYDWVADRLASSGLWYAVSPASWYNESGTLIVIGRADVLERVELPVGNDPQAWRDLRTARGWPPHIDWEIVEAMQLAREQVERNRLAQKAVDAEAEGDWQGALYWHCDTAYLDRTGGFHRQAREQIALAAQVASAHQGLDRSFCHFRNEKDRVAVCGQGAAKISRPELQRRLDKASLPREWDRFFARESHEADVGIPGFGNASILQGGPLRYWMARVESKDGPGICTVKDEEPASLSSPKNYSCPTPEGAVAAAVDIWRRYDQLVGAI